VLTTGEKLLKTGLGLWSRIGPGDADGLEAVLARDIPELGLDIGGVDQKSRSA
jgi:hypothetical protein